MIHLALVVAAIVCINCTLAVSAVWIASRHSIAMTLGGGLPLWIFIAGSLTEAAVVQSQSSMPAALVLLLGCAAVVVSAATDAACGYVFDVVTLPSLTGILLVATASHTAYGAALGAMAGAGALGILYALTRGRGLGLGDVKLAACIGAALGAWDGVVSLGVAFVLGGAYAAYLLVAKRANRHDEMRFAPYLAAGMLLVSLYRVAV